MKKYIFRLITPSLAAAAMLQFCALAWAFAGTTAGAAVHSHARISGPAGWRIAAPTIIFILTALGCGLEYYRRNASAPDRPVSISPGRSNSAKNDVSNSTSKRNIDKYKTDEGRSLIEFYLMIHLAMADPVAAFDRVILPGNKLKFRLNDEYAGGGNETAKRILAEKNLSMESVSENIGRIASYIENEPNGKEISQIIVVTNDMCHISIRKYINKMLVSDKILGKSACLEVMAIPHEVYHTVLEGDIAIEETLVHGLSLLRAVSIYREGRTDKSRMDLFKRAFEELKSLETANPKAAGRYQQHNAIAELIEYVERTESKNRHHFSAEEILPQAVKLSMKFISENLDIFESMFEEKTYSKFSEIEIFDQTMRMWSSNKQILLRGRTLK